MRFGTDMNPAHSEYCHCECPEGLSYSKLEETLNRVRMVHVKEIVDGYEVCYACISHDGDFSLWQSYPCETMRALAGDDL
jgi:hypothetical protein